MNDVSVLTREECVEILTMIGIQCYDHEPIEVLREAVDVNMKDGTIPGAQVDEG